MPTTRFIIYWVKKGVKKLYIKYRFFKKLSYSLII